MGCLLGEHMKMKEGAYPLIIQLPNGTAYIVNHPEVNMEAHVHTYEESSLYDDPSVYGEAIGMFSASLTFKTTQEVIIIKNGGLAKYKRYKEKLRRKKLKESRQKHATE